MTEIGGFADESIPQGTPPTGPTEHLDTVGYWRELYSDAIAVGQEKIDAIRKALGQLEHLHGADEARKTLRNVLMR